VNNDSNSEIIRIDKTFTTQQVAENLGVGRSTLNKYCRSLEDEGYSFYKDDSNYRAYTEHDVMALRELKEILNKNLDYDSAIKTISIKYRRNINGINIATLATTEESRFETRYIELFDYIKRQDEKIDLLIQVNRQMAEKMDTQMQLAATTQENRQTKITDWITQRRIESELEEEALSLWAAKPVVERLKKSGWFRKEEDIDRRDRFVRQYVNGRFEGRLKEEYDLE
jgi:biotin operon repressor